MSTLAPSPVASPAAAVAEAVRPVRTALVLSVASVCLLPWTAASARLDVDRAGLAAGELWRVVTGHLTHWSGEHLLWSLLVFAVVGALWERQEGARRFAFAVITSAFLISAAVVVLEPDLSRYRGLSGVDCTLVTALAVASWRRARTARRRGLGWALALTLGAWFAKVGWEMTTGTAVFVDTAASAFATVPIAHLVGGLWGVVLGLVRLDPPALSEP